MTDLSTLGPGDKFFYKNVGYGLTSYERGDDAVEIRDGKLFTETFSSIGMDWLGGQWEFDGGMGMKCYIVAGDDPAALAYHED